MTPHSVGVRAICASAIATLACTFVGKIFDDGLVHDEVFLKNKYLHYLNRFKKFMSWYNY
jgi:hypothetical protein